MDSDQYTTWLRGLSDRELQAVCREHIRQYTRGITANVGEATLEAGLAAAECYRRDAKGMSLWMQARREVREERSKLTAS